VGDVCISLPPGATLTCPHGAHTKEQVIRDQSHNTGQAVSSHSKRTRSPGTSVGFQGSTLNVSMASFRKDGCSACHSHEWTLTGDHSVFNLGSLSSLHLLGFAPLLRVGKIHCRFMGLYLQDSHTGVGRPLPWHSGAL